MYQKKRRGRVSRRLGCAAVAMAAGAAATAALPVTTTYIGPASGVNAVWSHVGNWSAGLPGSDDTAAITHADATSRDISLDIGATVRTLNIGNTGLGTDSLTQDSDSALTAETVTLGPTSGAKAGFTQLAGANHFDNLTVGSAVNSNATYTLNRGTLSGFAGSGTFIVGFGGTGTFWQRSGSVTVGVAATPGSGGFALAYGTASTGTYMLDGSSSTLTIVGEADIGISGTATFTQNAGTVTVGASAAPPFKGLYIGYSAGSAATYQLNPSARLISNGGIVVGGRLTGAGGAGTLNLAGGTATTPFLRVWNSAGTIVNLSAGTLNVDSIDTDGNPAHFNWTGGRLNVPGAGGLIIGTTGPIGSSVALNPTKSLGVTGALLVSGGTLDVQDVPLSVGGDLTVGSGGSTMLQGAVAHSAAHVNVFGGGTLNVVSGSLTTATVTVDGMLGGGGTVNAPVEIRSGGTLSPGVTTAAATLTIGGLTLDAGAKARFDPGDRVNVTAANALNIAGAIDVTLGGQVTGPSTLFGYTGALGGSVGNLKFTGGSAGFDYAARNNAAAHTVDLVARQVGTFAKVLQTNDLASGPGGGIVTSGGSAAEGLSAGGDVVLLTALTGASDGANQVVYRGNGTTLTPLARVGQSAPGPGGGTFADFPFGFFVPAINASGQVIFNAHIDGASGGGTATASGVFRADGSTLVAIARTGQAAPGGGAFTDVGESTVQRMNGIGQVAFVSNLSGATNGATSGVFRGDGTTTVAIARQKQVVPAFPGETLDGLYGPDISDSGEVVFAATSSATQGPAKSAIFRGAGSGLTLVALQGWGAANGGTLTGLGDLDIVSGGTVLFSAGMTGTTDGSHVGVFLASPFGGYSAIAVEKQQAPGGGAFGDNFAIRLDNPTRVTFESELAPTPSGVETGIFRWSAGTLTAVVREGQPAPGPGGGVFNRIRYGSPKVAAGGQVLFYSEIANSRGGADDDFGLFVTDGQETIAVMREAQSFAAGHAWATYRESINDFGQVSFNALLVDGGSIAQVFTPTLHWRATGNGNWDTSANWTLTLAPARVHDVRIDPATPLTVTGPAASTTVKSLTIGTGGAPATLQLGAAAVAIKTSTLAIDAAGGSKIDLKNSSLIVGGGDVASVRNLIISGFHNGAWDGPGVMTTAAGASGAIGYATGADAGRAGGTLGGLPVAADDVLVMPTLAGDANLDGRVDFVDLVRLAQNYNTTVSATTQSWWYNGDFTYDGRSDFADLVRLAQNYNTALAAPIPGASAALASDWAAAIAQVPEPTGGFLLAGGMLSVRGRRRSSRLRSSASR